jgi:N-acetylglucosaminyldiphosphoundecaprenol N-acetyl-beta-D-mannosaminyltransferase
MWWRYAKTNALFAGILAHAMIRHNILAPAQSRSVPHVNSTGSGG